MLIVLPTAGADFSSNIALYIFFTKAGSSLGACNAFMVIFFFSPSIICIYPFDARYRYNEVISFLSITPSARYPSSAGVIPSGGLNIIGATISASFFLVTLIKINNIRQMTSAAAFATLLHALLGAPTQ